MFDLESLLGEVETILKADLNTKIAAINSEKNDNIDMETISNDAYFLQSLSEKSINYDPFILYGVSQFENDDPGNFGFTSTKVLIEIVLVKADEGQDLQIIKKMLRFQRALREVIEDNFDSISHKVKMQVQSQVPIDLNLLNSSHSHKAIGITIKCDLG